MICFEKSADSAYFDHNGGQTTMSRKWKVDIFESLGIILIIFEVKPSIQKGVYGSAVSSQSKTFVSTFNPNNTNLFPSIRTVFQYLQEAGERKKFLANIYKLKAWRYNTKQYYISMLKVKNNHLI